MSLKGTVWGPIGPSPINEPTSSDNGLVTCVAVNPNNTNVLYLGTAQGGVWRSQDQGLTWTPIFDKQLSLGIGEPGGIAIDPNDTSVVYVGTSGLLGSLQNDTIIRPPSAGLFKSTDGGASWVAVGSGYPTGNTGNATQFTSQNIHVVVVDPANSDVLYLASDSGVFTSSNGGLDWTIATGINGDAWSLALDLSTPANARILYAGVTGSGVFKSTDGGQSFAQVLSATTPAVVPALAGQPFTRTVVALAPPTSPPDVNGVQVIYVTMAGAYNAAVDPIGVFISTDQGQTWAQQGASSLAGTTYGGYALDMMVDPASPGDGVHDTLLVGCIQQFRSTNSGASFTAHSVGHADTHTYTAVPQSGGASTVVYCGCDGGVDQSTDAGVTWTSRNGGGLQTGLFYNIAISPDATASATAGALQDNGVLTTAGVAAPAWNDTTGGDGWDVTYDGGAPPLLYASSGGPVTSIQSSNDHGQTWSADFAPPWTAADNQNYGINELTADPSASGTLYASGLQNLWQRLGGSWRIIASLGSNGNVDVAPTNGNNVVIAAGSKVYLSTNALAATVGPPTGVTFADITRNLSGRPVARVVFDPVDPTVMYAVLTGFGFGSGENVFRTTVGATSWTDISPNLNVACGAIALDGTTVPTTLYVGTDFGVIRSTDGGASWSILDDIHLPLVPVFDLKFNATAGVLRAGTYGRGVWEFLTPTGPAIAIGKQDGLRFGTVCGGPSYLTLTVYNVGPADLVVSNVERLVGSTDFTVLGTPATPITIAPGAEVEFTVRFQPTLVGVAEMATIRITSNDPTAPVVDVVVTGQQGAPRLAAAMADSGNFGNVCLGSFADEILTINNAGSCPLWISSIVGPANFIVPTVLSYPLQVSPGASVELIIRFQPSAYGSQAGTVTINSNDPASPTTVAVSGTAPAPKAKLVIADTGNFGSVCLGSFADEPLIVSNSGACTLTITGLATTGAEFVVPEVLSYPLTIGPGDSLTLPLRFQPSSFGAKSATITLSSNDPSGPLSVNVSGNVPAGKLAVAGSTFFGGVDAGCCADRTLSVCNVGDCALHVTSVEFRRKSRHWRLLHNPFPATVHPGSCLPVVMQYHAVERCARVCELVIRSDDPTTPEKVIDVQAYTVWDCNCRGEAHGEGCGRKDCDDCGRGCHQGYPCSCCDDDDDEAR